MKKLLIPLIVFAVFFLSCKEETVKTHNKFKFAIMTTSDLQSRIVPFQKKIEGKKIIVGGLERIAFLRKEMKGKYDYSLLVSTGDDMIGNFYSLFGGCPEMEGMSLAGYDIITPGNHEFDYGLENYKKALQYADFDLVSANLLINDSYINNKIKPYVIKEYQGIKIGIFGLITPDLLLSANTGPNVNVDKDIIKIAKDNVGKLKQNDCDIIIALTHIGTDLDKMLADSVAGIDIIVGGHSHQFVYDIVEKDNGNKTIIVQDGMEGTHLGLLDFDYQNDNLSNFNWSLILLDSTIGSDNIVKSKMDSYVNAYVDSTNKTIGRTLVDIDCRENSVRYKEANSGDLITDAWIDWFPDVDIALVNGGGIRSDKIFPKGNLTYNNLLEMMPFRGEIYKVKLRGADLKQILEISASSVKSSVDSCPNGQRASSGAFLQMGGIKVIYDTTKPAFCAEYKGRDVKTIFNKGSRVISVRVEENGNWSELDTNKIYTILTNDWIATGGDGYYIFLQNNIEKENTTLIDVDILTHYITKYSPIEPKTEERIKFIP